MFTTGATAAAAFGHLITTVTKFRRPTQYGLAALVALCLMVVFITTPVQQLPSILVFAAVPLILVIGDPITRLKKLHQFVIIILVTLTAFGFMGVALVQIISTAAAAQRAITAPLDAKNAGEYSSTYLPVQQALDHQFIAPRIEQINAMKSYNEYRSTILSALGSSGDRSQIAKDLEKLVVFFEGVVACTERRDCTEGATVANFKGPITGFWYSYRPIIEEMRFAGYGKDFALRLQRQAEIWRPPEFRSEVIWDDKIGSTLLRYPNG
jgi:hypothetical protein